MTENGLPEEAVEELRELRDEIVRVLNSEDEQVRVSNGYPPALNRAIEALTAEQHFIERLTSPEAVEAAGNAWIMALPDGTDDYRISAALLAAASTIRGGGDG